VRRRHVPYGGVWLVVGLVMPAAGSACARRSADTAEPPLVAVSVARLETLKDSLTAAGTVVPASTAEWLVVAPEAARIAELPHAEGDTVQPGDLLVRFDIPAITEELTMYQTGVAQANSALTTAQAALAKATLLWEQGVIPRRDFDARKEAVLDAQSALNNAQAQLDRATIAASRATVKAKFAGTIVNCWHKRDDFVQPTDKDPIMRLVDPSRVQVAVTLSLAELARVLIGQSAMVSQPGGAPEPAIVVARPTPSDASATSVDVRLNFTQPTNLIANTDVDVEILLDTRVNAIVVPRAAVQKDDDATYVMIAGPDDRVQRHDIRLGLVTHDVAQILSGVNVGDRVITSTSSQIVDGMVVRIGR